MPTPFARYSTAGSNPPINGSVGGVMRDTSRHFPARTTLLAAALVAGAFAAASSAALHHTQPPGLAGAPVVADQDRRIDAGEWPAVTREAKPWSRWWWH